MDASGLSDSQDAARSSSTESTATSDNRPTDESIGPLVHGRYGQLSLGKRLLDILDVHRQHESSLEQDLVAQEKLKDALKQDAHRKIYTCRHRHSVDVVGPGSQASLGENISSSSGSGHSLASFSNLLHGRNRRGLLPGASPQSHHQHGPCAICAAIAPVRAAWLTHKAEAAYRSQRKRTVAEQEAEETLLAKELMSEAGSSRRLSAMSGVSAANSHGGKSRRWSAVSKGEKSAGDGHMPLVLEGCPPGVQPVRPLPEGRRMSLDDD